MEAFSFLDQLNALPGLKAGWVERISDLPIKGDRDAAMRQLRPAHQSKVVEFAGADARWWRAEQIHGCEVAVIPAGDEIKAADGLPIVAGVDGILTNRANQMLSIYVADCGAIWLADTKSKAIGLLHSGKKGTECNILGEAVDMMHKRFGTKPADIIAVLSPCIRPPHYEVDFAAEIATQASNKKIGTFIDCGLNTADDLKRFYSYRAEKGQTGRMMAMILRE